LCQDQTLTEGPIGLSKALRLAGRRLLERLDPCQLYGACYALLTVTALKLPWDGLRGYNSSDRP
jgi:hypothetical protein